jgi:hypothetical protein
LDTHKITLGEVRATTLMQKSAQKN